MVNMDDSDDFKFTDQTEFEKQDNEFLKQIFSKSRIQDDWVHYSIHNTSKYDNLLPKLYKSVFKLTENYLWHLDGFNLDQNYKGETNTGGYVPDEWRIIAILYKISLEFKDLYIQIEDADGDILAIDAADHLPEFMDDDIQKDCVWLSKGRLLVGKSPGFENAKTWVREYTFEKARLYLEDWRNEVVHVQNFHWLYFLKNMS